MINTKDFKIWLTQNTTYSERVICDIVSRMKRADNILNWYNEEVYLFYLEHTPNYKELSPSVRSQLKKAVILYNSFALNL